LPSSIADALQSVVYRERALAWLQVDAALRLAGAGGDLENYGFGAIRLGEPALDQAFFLEGVLPLAQTPFVMPSIELGGGRVADLHFYRDGECVWVVLLDVTAERDQARLMQQKAYEMTLLQEKEALLNRHLGEKSAALAALSTKLAKYLAPQLYQSIFTGRQDVRIASERKKLTICFTDIAGFTEITDKMESEDLTQLLNHYLTEMSKIALEHGATIDKYVGDAVVLFFGDPETRGVKEDALACVKMALAMQKRVGELAQVWRDMGIETPFRCRIGINTGYCTVGNFGSEDRMDYTVIGGAVNLASRLEQEAWPGSVLISHETYAHVRDEIHCEERGRTRIRGMAYPVATYEVIRMRADIAAVARSPIRADLPNLRLELQPESMSADERQEAAATLRHALDILESRTEP
jgi:class 3 adenylate cyclase